jgi:PhoPQ-activated pathogenicity-related protein
LKLYSDYETESIESSQLRHRLKFLPITIKNEIQGKKKLNYLVLSLFIIIAAVRMARESNVTVIQKLQKELDTYLQQVREYTEQDTLLNAAITALQ